VPQLATTFQIQDGFALVELTWIVACLPMPW
jgi:hypothetical protein